MNDLSKTERERQNAQAYMDNLRQRGLLSTPRPIPLAPVQGALALALAEPDPDERREGATLQQYALWDADPAAMTDEAHALHCSAGVIVLGNGDDLTTRPCPVCRTQDRAAELRKRLVAAGVDGRYLDSSWETLERPAPLDRVAAACGDILGVIKDGECLLLWSEETGSGKTQAAMLAAKAAIAAGKSAQVVNIARLAVEIRDGYGDRSGGALKESQARQMLTGPDLLVIDDLGAGETDSASVERRLLFLALDERQTFGRPTIVTSNLPPQELAGIFGARILARLSPLTILHINHGKNFRLKPGRKSRW